MSENMSESLLESSWNEDEDKGFSNWVTETQRQSLTDSERLLWRKFSFYPYHSNYIFIEGKVYWVHRGVSVASVIRSEPCKAKQDNHQANLQPAV